MRNIGEKIKYIKETRGKIISLLSKGIETEEDYKKRHIELIEEVGRYRVKCFGLGVKRNKLIKNYKYVKIYTYFLAHYIIILVIARKLEGIENEEIILILYKILILLVLLYSCYYISVYISYKLFIRRLEKKNAKKKIKNF